MIYFEIMRAGSNYSCRADGGEPFFVGRRTQYKGRVGLFNVFRGSPLKQLPYRASEFRPAFDFWATFIEPTAAAEGLNFLTLNTYDRAAFTFGFAQFAAHVAEGDFVLYLRRLLARPEAADYFPGLALINGHIHQLDDRGGARRLEDPSSSEPLKKYLNPTRQEVEDAEIVAAARLIHWTTNDPEARKMQVEEMVAITKRRMREAERRKLADGRAASHCCVMIDILHNGRGTWAEIRDALESADPLASLLEVGNHERRAKVLRDAIDREPEFASLHWSSAAGNFV
jgi:hypothetical protein